MQTDPHLQTIGDQLEARNDWGQRLLSDLIKAAKEADEAHLFVYPETIHLSVIKTAIISLLASCDLPQDLPLCADIVRQAFGSAVGNMEIADRIN